MVRMIAWSIGIALLLGFAGCDSESFKPSQRPPMTPPGIAPTEGLEEMGRAEKRPAPPGPPRRRQRLTGKPSRQRPARGNRRQVPLPMGPAAETLPLLSLQAAGAGLEILAASPWGGRIAAGLLRAEIGQIRPAIAAADHFDVKRDVARRRLGQGAEQVTAQLLARRTTQPVLPPDFAQRVDARAAPDMNRRELRRNRSVFPCGFLDARHLLRRQRFVEIGFKVGRVEGHGAKGLGIGD